jgi:hypothetical protein
LTSIVGSRQRGMRAVVGVPGSTVIGAAMIHSDSTV